MVRPHGVAGSCKVCRSKWLPEINLRLRDGANAADITRFVKEVSKGTLSFNRQTIYKHRDEHLNQPASTPAAEAAGSGEPEEMPAEVDSDLLLKKVQRLAYQGILEDPGQVTLKMGLEATKILEARKDRQVNVLLLAKILTGQAPALTSDQQPVIEGEYREVAALAPSEPVEPAEATP